MNFEPGQTYNIQLKRMPYGSSIKIHIMYVLDGAYNDEKIIVYKYYASDHPNWLHHATMYWHQGLILVPELEWRIKHADK